MPTVLTRTAALHAILFVVCFVLMLVDDTQIMGINRWIKPMKFTISVGIYLATMAWIWPVAVASPAWKSVAEWTLCLTLIFEIICVIGQAARGTISHYNTATPFDGIVFGLMGIMIFINIGAAALVMFWTLQATPSAYVWGVRLGLLLFVVFALEGVLMVQRMQHAVGLPDGGPGLPLLNWSRTGGDLRIAHFIGMHALQLLPLLGWLTGRVEAVWAGFGILGGLAATLLLRALQGIPLVR